MPLTSTANCRPTAAKPSATPGSPAIPNRRRWSPLGARKADSIRARYGDVVNEPVPERLQLDQIIKNDITNARARSCTWMATTAAAAVLAAFVIGGGVGWYAHGAASSSTATAFDEVHRRRARRL